MANPTEHNILSRTGMDTHSDALDNREMGLMVDRCPHCGDDIGHLPNEAYALHVTKTCYAIGKSGEELQKIREANR